MSRRVLVMVNKLRSSAPHAERAVLEAIESHGELVQAIDAFDDTPIPEHGSVDLVLVIGGDGTIMHCAKRCIDLGAPMLGVNLGKVGFMAGYELDRFLEDAPGVLSGEAELVTFPVPTMIARLYDDSGDLKDESAAINDFVVTAGPPYGLIRIDINIDGHPGPTVSGDGVIVSSALGSTAYNVSSGGPIVSPKLDARVITPIAAHSLSFRPIVVPPASVVRLTAKQVNAENGHGTCLLADGRPGPRVRLGDVVEVCPSGREDLRFVADPKLDYWAMLIHKMGWALAPDAGGINTPDL